MRKNGNQDNTFLKPMLESVEVGGGGVCLSHHFATMFMGLHNPEKEGKHVLPKKKKKTKQKQTLH